MSYPQIQALIGAKMTLIGAKLGFFCAKTALIGAKPGMIGAKQYMHHFWPSPIALLRRSGRAQAGVPVGASPCRVPGVDIAPR
ncbi:MAG TPA: hypothetical protein VFK44_09350 [Bacillales bacterium]|nr:hypothetical protein [Bacillales bacterium]